MNLSKLVLPVVWLLIALAGTVPAVLNFRDAIRDLRWAEWDPVGRSAELTVAWDEFWYAGKVLLANLIFLVLGLWGIAVVVAADAFAGYTDIAAVVFVGLLFALEVPTSIASWIHLRNRRRVRST